MRKTLTIFSLVLSLFLASPVLATIVTYTDVNSWTSAIQAYGPRITEGFDDAILVAGLTITGTNVQYPYLSTSAFAGRLVLHDVVNESEPVPTTFSMVPPVMGFGALWDLAGPGGQGTNITVVLNFWGGGSTTLTDWLPSTLSGQWLGLISTDPISSFTFYEGTRPAVQETYEMELYKFTVARVPEPSLLLLLGAGFFGLAGLSWSRSRQR
jgi:hypothetical protein